MGGEDGDGPGDGELEFESGQEGNQVVRMGGSGSGGFDGGNFGDNGDENTFQND